MLGIEAKKNKGSGGGGGGGGGGAYCLPSVPLPDGTTWPAAQHAARHCVSHK